MKILSFGDIHFNCGYDQDLVDSTRQIIRSIIPSKVDMVVITGDIYDRSSDPGSRNIAADLVREMAMLVPVAVVRGNHDAPGDLMILSRLSAKNEISVYETPHSRVWQSIDSRVRFLFMPWLTKARWQSLHPEDSKESGDKTVSQMVVDYIKSEVTLHPEEKVIVVGHMTVAGAKCQAHQQMGADGVTVGIYDFADSGVYAAMLGHIHLKQECGGTRFFYNGSIAALDYGESPEKYFSILDTNSGEVEWHRLSTIHRQDVSALWSAGGIIIENKFPPELLKGARVRANLRVEGGDNVDQAKKQLEQYLISSDALEYQINPQVTATEKVRAVEISKAESLSDKLREFWKATAEPEPDTKTGMLAKLDQLEDENVTHQA